MATEAEVREAFGKQVGWSEQLGSPFMAKLCRVLSDRLDRTTAVGRRVLDWPGNPDALADGLPLRLAGALHALVRRGDALAKFYPPNPEPAAEDLWPALRTAFQRHEDYILSRLAETPQTNEVGRSGPLMAGLSVIAAENGLPASLFELGASAGLNLNLDRFAYRLGELETGDPASKVRLSPHWTGPSPPKATVTVKERQGVDISPLDIADPQQRELLPAYVWPDQEERLQRVVAAIDIGLAHPPPLTRGDAADWIERVLQPGAGQGATRVVYHTIAFQYFPPSVQARIRTHLETVGAAATARAPLAWLRYEADPEFGNKASLRLTTWPGKRERVLGVGHPHGATFRFF